MKHLRYDCMGAAYAGENRHPLEVMRELGIMYDLAIPQSIGAQWWVFNCEHRDLPSFIEEMKCDEWMATQYRLPESYKNA
ncbi:hypothetical protein [Enterobacter chengduensis]|uniref:hypothetical protein n=1 Tax=Enterobacter chengduensis TaxID=2494701 RepID=UPI0020039DB3|nr:hypothetical protein [Enterobacter chengduensis]MCK7169401.1 hypothetical protein [Enterobacter chengduensis]MCM8030786.1 hypothetical protein [Enterobacter chengduensis]